MTLEGTYRAVLDRVEDGVGVLLVEDDGEVIEEVHVDPDELPADVGDGAVLESRFEAGEVASLSRDRETTEQRRKDLQSRFDDLAQRPPGRDDEG